MRRFSPGMQPEKPVLKRKTPSAPTPSKINLLRLRFERSGLSKDAGLRASHQAASDCDKKRRDGQRDQ